MSRFTITTDSKKRKRQKVWAYITLGACVMFVISLFIPYGDPNDQMTLVGKYIRGACFTLAFFSAMSVLKRGKDHLFVDINADAISFQTDQLLSNEILEKRIAWNDVQWMKQDRNDVYIFMSSSFHEKLSLSVFSNEQREYIIHELLSLAASKTIRLVNFSAIPMTVA